MGARGWTLADELKVKYGDPRHDDELARQLGRSLGAIKGKRAAILNWERLFHRHYEDFRG